MPLLGTRGGGSARGFGRGARALTVPDTGAMFPLGMVQVGSGGSSTITFSSIPSTYKHLQVRVISRTNYTGSGGGIENYARFNSDSGSNYAYHVLSGNGASAGASASTSQTNLVWGYSPRSADTSGIFGAYVVDILDYANTNKYKTTRSLAGEDYNGSGTIRFWSGLWQSTTAIDTITITPISGNSFVQYSSFALYGIKGA